MAVAKNKKSKAEKIVKNNDSMDFLLLTVIILMLLFGLAMLFSASTPTALAEGNIYSIIVKQAILAAIGFAGMIFISKIDYRIYQKFAKTALIVAMVIMYIVPLIGFGSHGATRQIAIGGISFQPSELMKFVLVLYFADRLSKTKESTLKSFKRGILPNVIILVFVLVSCLLQRHLSAAVVLIVVPMLMLIVAGLPVKYIAIAGGVGIATFVPLIMFTGYRMDRITALFKPYDYKLGIGWQIIQSLYAVGSGGLFGLGLGQSRQKYLYLPEAHNDYIFAIICEELGFFGAILVLALFSVFIWRGLSIALKSKDKFGLYLAFGITAIIGIQMLINIGVVLSILPSTGMQLPFFSSGGTSLLIMLFAMGVLLNISKKSNINKL